PETPANIFFFLLFSPFTFILGKKGVYFYVTRSGLRCRNLETDLYPESRYAENPILDKLEGDTGDPTLIQKTGS
ncbi:hypothetical protein, partial [Leptospira interrogans]